jgi:hypothetical protein
MNCNYEFLNLLHCNFSRISIGFINMHILDSLSKFQLFLGSGLLVTAC